MGFLQFIVADVLQLVGAGPHGWVLAILGLGVPLMSAVLIAAGSRRAFIPLAIANGLLVAWLVLRSSGALNHIDGRGAFPVLVLLALAWQIIGVEAIKVVRNAVRVV